MSVDISMHNAANNPPKATASAEGTSSWLSIRQGETEITIFASRDKADAIRMLADVFNDAFAAKPEPEPQGPPTFEDSDIPW